MRFKSYKNISNYFMCTEDVGSTLTDVLRTGTESVFGIEIQKYQGEISTMFVSPPHIRLGPSPTVRRLAASEEGLKFLEGYLSSPYFFPLYTGLGGLLVDDIKGMDVESDFSFQWLFKKRVDEWKGTAIDMYTSYLDGNEFPEPSRIVRGFQDKMLSALNRIGSFHMQKDYVEEAEQKILSEGYQFQLRVAVPAEGSVKEIQQAVNEVLSKYDSYNAVRVSPLKERKLPRQFKECVITHGTQGQIVSIEEVLSLLGGDVSAAPAPTVSAEVNTPEVIKLLPVYEREEAVARDNIATDIAEALKRVKLIKQARVYNDRVITGIRLSVMQCSIPSDKTISAITGKQKDIQAALGVPSLGIAQGDGPDMVKFSIPNEKPAMIALRELIDTESFLAYADENPLAFVVGVDEINNPIYLSLAKLPHMLVSGTTGSGKSVFVNTMVVTWLATHTPDQLRLVMIDPKQVEFQAFEKFPHVDKVITEMEEAATALERLVNTMEERYTLFKDNGVKNITVYNQKVSRKDQVPYMVCVIDEYADLKDTNPEVEDYIVRLGQKARAAGIHLVIATQRPSANILSGKIKTNIPSAFSFNLSNNVNYKTVFGTGIPYDLLGKGDGVFKVEGYPKEFQRFQSAIISPDEAAEEEVLENLARYYQERTPTKRKESEQSEEVTVFEEENRMTELKKVIVQNKETRVSELRELMGIKTSTLTELMNQLVEEGFLSKNKARSKGYELSVSAEEMQKYL